MHILIPIPVGAKRVAVVQGATWKTVDCAQCQQQYAYLLELEATGTDHDYFFMDPEGSSQRAQTQAEFRFAEQARNVVLPIPCPNCGTYQDDMVRLLKDEGTSNWPTIAGLGVAAASLVPLVFGVHYGVTVAGVAAGLVLVGCGDWIQARYNPNAGDPERRKAIGRKHAVWGEQLAEALAADPHPVAAAAPPDPPRAPNGMGMTDEGLDSIDRQLAVTMPPEYRAFVQNPPADFLKAYGGHELFIDPRLIIYATRSKRSEMFEVRMPDEFVVIGEPGNGDFICLDVSKKPATVVEYDHERREFQTVAASFESWVRKLSRSLRRGT